MPARSRRTRGAAAKEREPEPEPEPEVEEEEEEVGEEEGEGEEEQDEDDDQENEDEGEDEEERDHGALQQLQFNEPLSWRAGKPIPVAKLLQRLEKLGLELRQLEQEETDCDSLANVSHELAGAHLLGHRDKGVRAWTACCLVDILRLTAPTAPFNLNRVKDIFTMIVTSIIPALADPSNAYNDQHIYVLSSLADVKSIILLTDVHAPDALIIQLFTSCFDIVSGSSKASTGEDLAKSVEYDLTRLLVPIIDEAPNLAPEVIDAIITQFIRVDPRALDQSLGSSGKGKKSGIVDPRQGTLLLKEYPPAYNMAKAICNACPEKMTTYISQYFNNVILDASGSGANGLSKSSHRRNQMDDSEDEGENVKDLDKAHRLIRELWRACPDVLQNVVPQIEAELSADSLSLRLLATQTIGDLAAGIGVAGPPPDPNMDPATYPPLSLANELHEAPQLSPLLTPLSPKPFSQSHSTAYESFLTRRQDRSASVRASWATAIGRILLTSAGGSGLSTNEEIELINGLVRMLGDADEKVRIAAVEIIGKFGFAEIVKKFGIDGGLAESDSLLSILADRVKDRKHAVREQAMSILGRMWAAASGELEANNEQVVPILKDIPSKIFDAFYTNNLDIQVLLDRVIYEVLLPLNYPPIRSKSGKGDSSQARKLKAQEIDADSVRVRRILTLVKGLDERSKKVFFALQGRQLKMETFISFYLTACEDYNGGVMEEDEDNIKARLTKVIDTLARMLPEPSRVSADLWKFANMHDRHSYQLLRSAMAAKSDYKTVTKAIRDFSNRINSSTSATTTMLETLMPLVYRSSSLIFNKSHIPPIMDLSRTDELGLGNTAHEILRETSSQNPEVLETHIKEICQDLETQAPTSKQSDDPAVAKTLKACAGFAKRLPAKLPSDRKFIVALTNYAMYSSSPVAAKNAVSIIMATTNKTQMYAADLVKSSVKNCRFGSDHFLTKLAAISQLNLLAPGEADDHGDEIINIATNEILLKSRNPEPNSGYSWSDDVDEETSAKEWALKILVNRVRSKKATEDDDEVKEYLDSVYNILNTLITDQGELSGKKDTPPAQKSRLRLLAGKLVVKLCASRNICDRLFTPANFNHIALLVQDPLFEVRSGFIGHLKKKLAQNTHLGPRWYAIAFLLAFEPNATLHDSTMTWLRSRGVFFARQSNSSSKGQDKNQSHTTMEVLFARLLSLLAHHPDYPPESSEESTKVDDLVDFTRYILFYLSTIANEKNLSLIFHIAQRAKQVRDAISDSDSDLTISNRLRTLSDLSQATIRRFAEIYSQQHKIGGGGAGSGVENILQTYPGKMRLSSSLFSNITSQLEAQNIAEQVFLPEGVEDRLDRVVRAFMKPKSSSSAGKKRKIENSGARKGVSATNGGGGGDDEDDYQGGSAKKVRKEKKKQTSRTVPIRRKSGERSGIVSKESKRKKRSEEDDWGSDAGADGAVSSARRKSGRGGVRKSGVSYAEADSDQADEEMVQWNQQQEKGEEEKGEEEEEENEEEEGEGGDESETLQESEDAGEAQKQKGEEVNGEEDTEMSDVPSNISSPPPAASASPSPPVASKPRRGRPSKAQAKKPEKTPPPPRRGGRTTRRRAAA